MRRFALISLLAAGAATPLAAQGLRDKVTDLFRFGLGCNEPVCLSVGTGHGDHYNPAVREGGDNLIGFLTNAIAVSISNIPISAASGGAIWGRSPEGLPVRTETSSGPIFAERAQTLGRGRVLFSTTANRIDYRSLRGVPLNGLMLTFPHQDVDNDGLGTPSFESDLIEVTTRINLNVTSVTPVLSYGLTDRVDLSVAVPLIRTSLTGQSEAQVIPYSTPTPHFFGTPQNPLFRATAAAEGTSSGIGDVAVRLKANLASGPGGGFALLGDVRLPTGKEEDFLGTGQTSYSVIGVGSLRRGNFSPHINAGYVHRGGEFQNDAILATLGFDHLMARRATFAVEVITGWDIGSAKLAFPEPVTVTTPQGGATSVRVVRQTNIPDRRDNFALGSVGAKLGMGPGVNLLLNALVPLNQGGLQPNAAWTVGLEYSF